MKWGRGIKRVRNIFKSRAFVLLICLPLMTCVTVTDSINPYNHFKAEKPEFQTPIGPPLQCLIDEGSANFADRWFDFEPVRFNVSQRQSRDVMLYRKGARGKAELYVRFEEGGQRLVFCPSYENLPEGEQIDCASIYALGDDLRYGIKRTLDVPDIIRGGALKCGYDHPGPERVS